MGYRSDSVKKLCERGMLIGGLAALEHYLSYGRLIDEEKKDCHGKYGLGLFLVSLFGRLLCESQES